VTDTASNRTATIPYRVRFDECAADGLARTSALLRYAQDVAWIHSERLGFDRDWYAARGLTWLVRTARVVVLRPVPLGTTLDVSTTVDGFRKVWARRRTDGRLADGTLAFWAHTDWVIVDARGLPTRVPAEFPAVYGELPGPFEPGRVALPPTPAGAAVHRGRVRPQDVDPLGHVNNAAYLDYLEEALLGAGPAAARAVTAIPRTVRIEYLLQAAPGAIVAGSTWRDDALTGVGARWAWRLTDDGADLARGTLDGLGGTPDTPDTPDTDQADRSAP
jgi:acyl-CoA thioesterase FadM